MRLAGPERELVKNSNWGAWRERVMFQKIPASRFLETTGRGISVGTSAPKWMQPKVRSGLLKEFADAPLPGGGQRTGRRDDLHDEGREVIRAGVRVQDASTQRLAAAEDGTGDEGAPPRLNRLG
jgi:hypothetical protein